VDSFNVGGHFEGTWCLGPSAYDGKTGSNTIAVLELPPVVSPLTAVPAYVISEVKK
jgi:hypothetical protein